MYSNRHHQISLFCALPSELFQLHIHYCFYITYLENKNDNSFTLFKTRGSVFALYCEFKTLDSLSTFHETGAELYSKNLF